MRRKLSPQGRANIVAPIAIAEFSDKTLYELAQAAVRAGLMTEREALERLAKRAGVTWGA
jgi:hypothetical protein